MILTFDEYNTLKESEESANIYEEILFAIMEQINDGPITDDTFVEYLKELRETYDLGIDFDFSTFLEENEEYFEIDESENGFVINLSDQGTELYEAQGTLTKGAKDIKGAMNVFKKPEKKWYDVVGGHASKAVTGFQKQKTKQKKLDMKASDKQDKMARKDVTAQRKHDLKMAKVGQ